MRQMYNRKVIFGTHAAIVCLAAAIVIGGCISARTDVTYGPKGRSVGHETLKHVKVGQTNKTWLLCALGEPSSQSHTSDGTEILRYCYTKKVDSDFEMSPLFDFHNKTEDQTTLYFELKDGIVAKFWKDK